MILLHWALIPAAPPARVTAAWLELLPEQRRRLLARGLGTARGLESLAGLALLAHCAEYRPLPPLSRLEQGPGGKPCWSNGPDFSIAHAAGMTVCAVAAPGMAIGVDVEPAGAVHSKMLRLVTSAAEREQIHSGSLSATALWTRKEAVLKAASAGILAAGNVEIRGAIGHHAGRDYHLKQLDIDRNFVLSIATTAPASGCRVVHTAASRLFDAPRIADRRRAP